MKISKVIGREIFDSRGYPTIECELTLEGQKTKNTVQDGESFDSDSPEIQETPIIVTASVPAGKSTGKYEAIELRDGKKRLDGKGVIKAVRNLENIIGPAIIGKEPDVISLDVEMLELDGTDNKSNLGANAILAASLAILKAQAIDRQLEIYELVAHLCKLNAVSIPIPFFNFINGGMHADNKIDMQEFLIIPTEQHTFRSCMELAAELFYNLKSILKEKNLGTCIGDEGGFAPKLSHEKEILDVLMLAIEKTTSIRGEFTIAIDVAASTLYDSKTKKYSISGKKYTGSELGKYYEELISNYPIIAIEDPFDQDDLDSWKEFTANFGNKIQIIGDDLFATNPDRISNLAPEMLANSAIIKPNQIGTVTETLQAILTCKENGLDTIISHRSGETCDSIIADIAIGTQAGQIKAGGLNRGERLAKYNRLLQVEDKLTMEALQ